MAERRPTGGGEGGRGIGMGRESGPERLLSGHGPVDIPYGFEARRDARDLGFTNYSTILTIRSIAHGGAWRKAARVAGFRFS
jgi:hypothetical protein